ncbi:MAG: hypothetical protein Q8P75_01375 [bacterium]|nr:hypothetical protein [bacterium]
MPVVKAVYLIVVAISVLVLTINGSMNLNSRDQKNVYSGIANMLTAIIVMLVVIVFNTLKW